MPEAPSPFIVEGINFESYHARITCDLPDARHQSAPAAGVPKRGRF